MCISGGRTGTVYISSWCIGCPRANADADAISNGNARANDDTRPNHDTNIKSAITINEHNGELVGSIHQLSECCQE